MRAGKLRHRVALMKATTTEDAYGEEVKTWGESAKFWAQVVPLSGKEIFESHTLQNVQGYKVRFRPRKDISVTDRVIWNGVTLEIETPAIDPFGRNDELNVICKGLVDASI